MENEAQNERPSVIVGALVVNPEGRILLARSAKWKDKYTVPGGHIEAGEKMMDALKREVKEETGLDVTDVQFLCALESIFDSGFWKKKHYIFVDYACKTKSTTVKLNEELQSHLWAVPKEALYLDLAPFISDLIKEYVKKFPNGY